MRTVARCAATFIIAYTIISVVCLIWFLKAAENAPYMPRWMEELDRRLGL